MTRPDGADPAPASSSYASAAGPPSPPTRGRATRRRGGACRRSSADTPGTGRCGARARRRPGAPARHRRDDSRCASARRGRARCSATPARGDGDWLGAWAHCPSAARPPDATTARTRGRTTDRARGWPPCRYPSWLVDSSRGLAARAPAGRAHEPTPTGVAGRSTRPDPAFDTAGPRGAGTTGHRSDELDGPRARRAGRPDRRARSST